MVIEIKKIEKPGSMDDEEHYPYEIKLHVGTVLIKQMNISKDEFLDLYRQMTEMIIDDVVRNYNPDKPRKGFGGGGGDEPHKKQQGHMSLRLR